MFVREAIYYFMSDDQLGREIARLRNKLDTEQDVNKKMGYLASLGDVLKTLIRRYRHDDELMVEVRRMLYNLRSQLEEALEES